MSLQPYQACFEVLIAVMTRRIFWDVMLSTGKITKKNLLGLLDLEDKGMVPP